jgi:hypothetical protein
MNKVEMLRGNEMENTKSIQHFPFFSSTLAVQQQISHQSSSALRGEEMRIFRAPSSTVNIR